MTQGDQFGRLTVLAKPYWVPGVHYKVKVRCACGVVKDVWASDLRCGKIVSCGGLACRRLGKTTRTHGRSHTKLYRLWQDMFTRCYNPNFKQFKDYGGRGIRVAKVWWDFVSFYQWAMANGYVESKFLLDHINNDGDYKPSNCRWATRSQANKNRRSNGLLGTKRSRGQ